LLLLQSEGEGGREGGWGELGGEEGKEEGGEGREGGVYASKLSLGPEGWRKERGGEGGREGEEEEEEEEEDFEAALARLEGEEAASRRREGRWWWGGRWMNEASMRWFLFRNKGRYQVKREQGGRRYI